jgi:cytochrome c oxidase subunit II
MPYRRDSISLESGGIMAKSKQSRNHGNHSRKIETKQYNKQKKVKLEWLFIAILMIAIVPIAAAIIDRSKSSDTTADQQVLISMSGFTPPTIEMNAGEKMAIELVNLDNNMHSDGGGWHQFASDELDFNYKVAPEKKKVIELTVDKPGVYSFYCDVCCGGKENPSMQGKIVVN